MKKMNVGLGGVSLIAFLVLLGISMLTVSAQQMTQLTGFANNLYNTGMANGTAINPNGTPVTGLDPTGVANPADPHYAITFYAAGAGNAAPATPYQQLPAVPVNSPPATFNPTIYGTVTTSGTAFLANPPATDPYDPGAQDWAHLGTTPNSQWISYQANMGTNASPAGTVLQTNSTAVSVYQLNLSHIPVGQYITIQGSVIADDNVSIYGNGKRLFTNLDVNGALINGGASFGNVPDDGNVNQLNYDSPHTATNTLPAPPSGSAVSQTTFLSSSSGANVLDFVVYNNGGYATGLNADLIGSFFSPIQFTGLNLTPNQDAVLTYINHVNSVGSFNPCFGNLILALSSIAPYSFEGAMEELSPETLSIFSSVAFNNATFFTQGMDDYFAHRRNQEGYFDVFPGIDTSGLTLTDPTIDPQLSQIYSHLLAWSPPAPRAGLLSDSGSSLAGTDTKDISKEMQPAADPTGWNVFLQGNVILGQDFSNFDIEHENATTSSFTLGSDYQFDKNFLAGAFFNYSHSDATLDDNGSSATIDTYSPGIFASYAKDGWYGNFLASYGHNDYSENRNINIADIYIESPNGSTSGDQEVVNTDGGYDFQDNAWTYGPTVGFQYVHLDIDSFTESGGCSSNLAIDDETADSFRSRLGGHVVYHTQLGGVVITPFLDASWQHEFLDDSRPITASMSALGDGQFTIWTQDTGRESALIATGVNFDIDQTETVFLNYQTQVTPNYYFGQSVLAGLKVAF